MVYLDGSDLNEIGRSPTVHLGDKINAGKRKRLTKTPFKATINTYIPINTISLFPHYKVVLLSFLSPQPWKTRSSLTHNLLFIFLFFSKVYPLPALQTQRELFNSFFISFLLLVTCSLSPPGGDFGHLTHSVVNCKSPP